MILSVEDVSKTFGATKAVKQVSFSIPEGRICGFLGPNGAGKTTLIRMIMDIYKPDVGTVTLGKGLEDAKRKNHIGYLPEERGLYTKTKVRETLLYFARLKGLDAAKASENTDYFLDRLGMTPVADTQIEKLSKGNQQKIQFISAIVSRPRLLILDEPFSGLDPVNVRLVSEVIRELRQSGISIVLSTHQMGQAETFCEQIFLFNKGELILSGELEPIIQQNSGGSLIVETERELAACDLFDILEREERRTKIELKPDITTQDLLHWLAWQSAGLISLQPYRVPLADIFIREVAAHG